MAKRTNPARSQYKDYLPACVNCRNYRPARNNDPFDEETQCAVYGDIPEAYLLMSDACGKLNIASEKEFVDIGNRPMTMLERMALDR